MLFDFLVRLPIKCLFLQMKTWLCDELNKESHQQYTKSLSTEKKKQQQMFIYN